MFAFSKPRYVSKRVHPVTQKTDPSYQFDVLYQGEMEEAPLALLQEADTVLTVSHLDEGVRGEHAWWLQFLQSFLTASSSYFSRPYTAQHLERILRHLPPSSSTPFMDIPHRVCCVPGMLELIGGQLLVHWKCEAYPARINIPDDDLLVSPEPHSLPATTEIEEWDADSVPEEQATETLADSALLLERQRVKEARLRAKLAVYRAQYQMNRFQDKYGREVSDSDEEEEDEDEESDEEQDRSFL